MLFERLKLKNYRCFEEEDVEFDRGVNVIYGLNGAGKSTLVEACFFGLYGADALRKNDDQLADVMTNGSTETRVELELNNSGEYYTITRVVKKRGSGVTQVTCELETPKETFSGASVVDPLIEELVRMDAEAFLNSAYIKQGEVEKLIEASSIERKRLIDNLLQLGKFEEYKNRASDIRVGVGRVRDKKESVRESKKDELQEIESDGVDRKLSVINEQIKDKEERISELNESIEEKTDRKEELNDFIEQKKEVSEEIESKEEQLQSVESEIESLESELEEINSEIESKKEDIDELIDELETRAESCSISGIEDMDIEELEQTKDEIENELEGVSKELIKLENKKENEVKRKERAEENITELEDKIGGLEDEIASIEESITNDLNPELDELREQKEEIQSEISVLNDELENTGVDDVDARKRELNDEREELVDKRKSIRDEKVSAEDQLERITELEAHDKCPECGQDVSESPHVKQKSELVDDVEQLEEEYDELGDEIVSIDENIDELEEIEESEDELAQKKRKLSNVEEIIEKQEQKICNSRDRIEEKEDEITSAGDEIEELDEEINECIDEIEDLDSEIENKSDDEDRLVSDKDTVGFVISKRRSVESVNVEIDKKENDKKHKRELVDEKREKINSIEEDINELQERIDQDKLAEKQNELESVEEEISSLNGSIDELNSELNDDREKRGELKTLVERKETLSEEIDALSNDIAVCNEMYSEMEAVEGFYDDLRSELREKNVIEIERLMNELFDVVYQNEAYEYIEIDEEYDAKMIEKGGGVLDPNKLSGGESALFNLSLRCAIYQLLVDGIGDQALMPPLIFDEPTVHLDRGHIEQLEEIVGRMHDVGVEQMIVISHDEQIIDSSDHRISVEQRESTNRSDAVEEQAVFI